MPAFSILNTCVLKTTVINESSTLHLESRWRIENWANGSWFDAEERANVLESASSSLERTDNSTIGLHIPKIFHRSHKYSVQTLIESFAVESGVFSDEKVERLGSNLCSCQELNPDYETRYYDDFQVESILQTTITTLQDSNMQIALARLSDNSRLSQAFVMKSDWFRLAVIYLVGGWWLDGDVRCIDSVTDVLRNGSAVGDAAKNVIDRITAGSTSGFRVRPESLSGCIFAWEGELPAGKSSPLNWAFGCAPRHPIILTAMKELANRVLKLKITEVPDPFKAKVRTPQGSVRYIDVLHTTGPGMLEAVFASYAGVELKKLRENFGETASSETWDMISAIYPRGKHHSDGLVLMLPYCFFRSRGCKHLERHFDDKVIFHHEFDTSWRPSFWHNYYREEKRVRNDGAEAGNKTGMKTEL